MGFLGAAFPPAALPLLAVLFAAGPLAAPVLLATPGLLPVPDFAAGATLGLTCAHRGTITFFFFGAMTKAGPLSPPLLE